METSCLFLKGVFKMISPQTHSIDDHSNASNHLLYVYTSWISCWGSKGWGSRDVAASQTSYGLDWWWLATWFASLFPFYNQLGFLLTTTTIYSKPSCLHSASCWHVSVHVWDEACVVFTSLCHVLCVCCGKDFAFSTLSYVPVCTSHTPAYILSNIITNSLHVSSLPSPLFDLVKHPIISPHDCHAGGVVTSKGSSPSPRPPGQPWGWPGVEPATLFPLGSILRSEPPRRCA